MEKKQGRGGSLALFTVLTRDGCCGSGKAITGMAAPKKRKERRHTRWTKQFGSTSDQRPVLILRHEKEFKTPSHRQQPG